MCGIAGKVFLQDKEVTQGDLQKLSTAIAHRGPDDEGFYISPDKRLGLVNRRLAIIDLSSKGHMPMNYKKRYWITFNGEIYNFQELRRQLSKLGYTFKSHSDTEVILALYDKYKLEFLHKLRGMFALAIYDIKEQTLFLAKDRLGKKPLKYYFKDSTFIFASELKALLTQKEVKAEIDLLAVHNFLTYGYVHAPHTGFKNIQKLEPGHYLLLDLKKETLIKRKYWKPDFKEKWDLSESEWSKKILSGLEEATKLRMIADVPIGAFLSGGVDSSAVVAMMARNSKTPIKTFTIGFKEKEYDETHYAQRIADIYKTSHTILQVDPENIELLPDLVYQYEEPYADSSAIITYLVSKLARRHVTVVLNGDGGDENFAGYDRYAKIKRDVILGRYLSPIRPLGIAFTKDSNHPFIRRTHNFLKKAETPLSHRFVSYNCFFENKVKESLYTPYFKDITQNINSYNIMEDLFTNASAESIYDKALWADLTAYFPEDLLTKVDIASMAISLEARSPFTDHNMVELAAKIPYNLKVKGRNTHKYILKKALEKIIPKENLYRKKMGFSIPLEHWFSGELNSYASSLLLSKNAKIKAIFNQNVIASMLKGHKKGNDFGPKLWSLLTLELWMKRFFN